MKIKIKVEYVTPSKIILGVGDNNTILISENKKKILASELYSAFNYKKENKYELEPLKKYDGIPSDYEIYLKECYELIDGILKDIQ